LKGRAGNIPAVAMEQFAAGLETLTPTKRMIYRAYLEGISTKEIIAG